MRRPFLRRLAGVVATSVVCLAVSAMPAHAGNSHAQITGSGSSWAANAVNQWIADVTKQGLQVVFTSAGSAQGRKDFAYKTTDFGVSDIPYQGSDPLTGQDDSSLGRKYVYLPIVAGGTSFPYHLSIAGQQVRNLRLSGETIAKIFTDKIGYWDDPAIKADNNSKLALPHIPIIPIVHSEGSGSTAQFTRYLATQYGSLWGPFNGGQNSSTEYFPKGKTQIAQNGSDGVMNFLTSSAGNGAIAYDEYSYALLANYPVVKLENQAGYFTAPTQYNDAVALTKAQIQTSNPSAPDYLTQNLDQVYTNPDKRTYPLSSYSYMIIPTGANGAETKTGSTAQRQTLADFLYYSICQGQAEMGPIGYSPLPLYLVQDGFGQIAKLKAADSGVDLTNRSVKTCNNPTFDAASNDLTNNRLAKIAPYPAACDKAGAGPCSANTGIVNSNPDAGGSVPSSGSTPGSNGGGGKTGTTKPGTVTGSTGGTAPGPGASTTAVAGGGVPTKGGTSGTGTTVDPNTGQLVSNDGANVAATSQDGQSIIGVPTNLAETGRNRGFDTIMYVLAVALLLGALILPVLVARMVGRRRAGQAA